MGPGSRRRAVVIVLGLIASGGCVEAESDLAVVRSKPGEAGTPRDGALHPPKTDAAVTDVGKPEADWAPIADAKRSDAQAPDVGSEDARSPVDGPPLRDGPATDGSTEAAIDAKPPPHCHEVERAIVEERRRLASCVSDADCTVTFDGLCASSGPLLGTVGCFLATNAAADRSALTALEREYASVCGQPGTCDCNTPPPASCIAGTCVVSDGCATSTSSTIPGVRIEFPAQRCTFTLAEAAAGVVLRYRLVVEQAISNLEIPEDPCSCTGPLHQSVLGGGQWYCECDFGCCDQGPGVAYPLVPGTSESTLTWTGRNWNGPSDTGQPMGPPFPPGRYGFAASLELLQPGGARPVPMSATGLLAVTLVP